MSQTIADGLQRIINAKTDIDGAIEAKDGTVTKGLENSDDDIMTIPEGATSYSPLTDKPAIDNHTLMPGNNTSSDLGLQTELTFDSAPTENSTNPVTSGGVYTALSGKQATIDSSHKLSADNVDDTNATNKFATAAQLAQISTNQTNIGKVQTQANWNTKNGVKNLIKLDDFSGTYDDLNVSCVNGEITISGTAGSSGSLYLTGTVHHSIDSSAYVHNKFAPDNVIFTGAPTTDNKDRIIIGLMKGSTYVYSFSTQTPTQDLSQYDYDSYYVYIPIISGQQYNGTWKPMLRPAFISDDTYEPHALPNTKITPELIELVDSGAKNSLSVNSVSASSDGFMFSSVPITLKGGTEYIFSYTNSVSVRLNLVGYANTSSSTRLIDLTIPFTDNAAGSHYYSIIPSADVCVVSLYANNVSTTTNLTNIMLCSKAAWDVSQKFVPYRPTYEKTVEQVAELSAYGGGKNKLNYTIDTAKALNTSSEYSWSGNTCTVNGITYTFNADKTISASGTIVDSTTNAILGLVSFTGAAGDILSAEQTRNAYIYLRGGNTATASAPYAEWDSGDVGVSRIVAIVIVGTAGTVNVKFKPMISTEADYNASSAYQPYAMSNAELTSDVSIVDITSNVTAESGYTVDDTSHLYRQGRHIFGMLIIKKVSGNFSSASNETIATIGTYAPEYQYLGIAGFTNTIWAVQNIGYVFVQNVGVSGAGSIAVMDTATTNNCVKIPIDYVTT